MNNNVKIARQLIGIARELVASEKRVAFVPKSWSLNTLDFFGENKWKAANTYNEFLNLCRDIEPEESACCLFQTGRGEQFFNTYGAPFYVYVGSSGIPRAVMHLKFHMIRDIMTDAVVTDDDILRSAAGVYLLHLLSGMNDVDNIFDEAKSQCDGDFRSFAKYYDEAKAEWNRKFGLNETENINE